MFGLSEKIAQIFHDNHWVSRLFVTSIQIDKKKRVSQFNPGIELVWYLPQLLFN